MKILYDHQIFTMQNIGGISRYFCEIIKNLPSEIDWELSGVFSNNLYANNYFRNKYSEFFPNNNFKGKFRIVDAINKLDSYRSICKTDYDVLHPTYYDPYFLKKNIKPFVVTFHDMIHEKVLDKHGDKIIKYKRELAYRSSHIIAVSEYTKMDILDIYSDIDPNKISVIYHGNSLKKKNECDVQIEYQRKKYILFVGARESYKNFLFLVKSIFNLLIKYDLELICTGKPFNNEELKLFYELKIVSRVFHKYVSDAQMSELYNNALFFVFPSFYEGFGIPILEAFASNCPVVLSDSSCFPEIAGDAAKYFDPTSQDSINNSVEELILNENYRRELILKGNARLCLFNWFDAANKTYSVYQSIV
ncbi:MAG: glycosyltransferase family 1 protein [Paludibacter sp.]|nr:glycosyltransferase family 1 protein [Paludibacter sp.]